MMSQILSDDLLMACVALLGLMILSATALRGWQGWLALKGKELDAHRPRPEIEGRASEGAARIELADLKERIRKLEAIASGVDL